MKPLFPALVGMFLFIVAGCASVSATGSDCGPDEQPTPEVLVEQAEIKYGQYLAANAGDRAVATEQTAEYLRGVQGVKEVTVRGSDTLFLIMDDGNELLLMLGQDRL
ncbi:hypothetical protein [Prosthecochloris sp. HL-130-GSB]|jgi:hypothetical protein|uniref:hypothetical protein n=1 Tax=Prosthecochloris sp. HL-130-GSB TaxID=1974213 RepID=UPI000A1C155D|nr:hypothetical protein [Prosthecochloris sp. HL-130-GSB]ARM31152.1 hypothetical protein B9H02_07400 [Prosthecochloris sp. HL-130-GSB]